MKLLIGIDGSHGSFAAVRFAGWLVHRATDEIVLYYSPPPLGNVSADVMQFICGAVFEYARRELPVAFQEAAQTIIGVQKPEHGLLIAADECRADMLVVGARGTGPLRQPALGSVARNLAHESTIPVLVVRDKGNRIGGAPLKILLANDGSPLCQHAGEVLSKFTFAPNSVGRVITVIENPIADHLPDWLAAQLEEEQLAKLGLGPFDREEARSRTAQSTTDGLKDFPPIFHNQRPIVSIGHPAQEILKAINTEQPDLVVVGARRLRLFDRMVLGSTSQHILAHAPCSVLVVRCHERP
jgi:nucleotide-binding universal stress UspA family protein